eukprot:20223-Heterococcus_DN1.PRE.6
MPVILLATASSCVTKHKGSVEVYVSNKLPHITHCTECNCCDATENGMCILCTWGYDYNVHAN